MAKFKVLEIRFANPINRNAVCSSKRGMEVDLIDAIIGFSAQKINGSTATLINVFMYTTAQ